MTMQDGPKEANVIRSCYPSLMDIITIPTALENVLRNVRMPFNYQTGLFRQKRGQKIVRFQLYDSWMLLRGES